MFETLQQCPQFQMWRITDTDERFLQGTRDTILY